MIAQEQVIDRSVSLVYIQGFSSYFPLHRIHYIMLHLRTRTKECAHQSQDTISRPYILSVTRTTLRKWDNGRRTSRGKLIMTIAGRKKSANHRMLFAC